MALVCDKCMKEKVFTNGEICQKCIEEERESKIDRSYMNNIYLPRELFEKFQKLHKQLDETKPDTLKVFSKFVKTLGTSFINHLTGKEINDPTPQVIIPKENTLDRIQKILNHNLAHYAERNDYDTPEDLEDWTVSDMHSDDWEQTLYQYVDNINIMEEDEEPIKQEEKPGDPQLNLPGME